MTDTKTSTKASAGQQTGAIEPSLYRTFYSHGFLRVSRWNACRSEYIQIGSFAGDDAQIRAGRRIADDRAALLASAPALLAERDALKADLAKRTARYDDALAKLAKLDADNETLRDALYDLQSVAVHCESFGRGQPYHHLIEQARKALSK